MSLFGPDVTCWGCGHAPHAGRECGHLIPGSIKAGTRRHRCACGRQAALRAARIAAHALIGRSHRRGGG